ncbi:MAG TPA: hypothetical protein PKD50_26040, partial [Leptospiraceae bacterium]|nr:hypothetical protein [Leptospiraceae bacterium]
SLVAWNSFSNKDVNPIVNNKITMIDLISTSLKILNTDRLNLCFKNCYKKIHRKMIPKKQTASGFLKIFLNQII